ncbi:hypothetical protein D7V97_41325 [Corallococcus sp. CA053C]|nr:DUF1629 domain-containing protein [Corallococcus sp. CA053C]RKG92032.1 hypothetical protein D7V97_41325 [Corallococcus sp. CA053C]
MRYFKLDDDMSIQDRWLLDEATNSEGQEIDDPWQFEDGCPVQVEEGLRIPVHHPGAPLDYSITSVGGAPIVHQRVADLFMELAPEDVQVIPVDVDGQTEPYCILVATKLIRCIDDEQSAEVSYWKPEDGRPEKTGKYRSVYDMRIDPTKVGAEKVFRTWGWTGALIVSEDIKDALERANVTGVSFREVTGPSAISPEERERNRKLRALYERTETAREAFWRTLGRLGDEVIIPVAGGGWPAQRQVWRLIHRPEGRTLFVTDGLSDFFVSRAEPSVGFGLELALETDEPLGDVSKSWQQLLLERIGNELAEHESLREKVKTGFLSMEVAGQHLPETLLTKDNRVGVLLGMDTPALPTHFTMPDGEVRLVTVKALLPAELSYLLEHGKQGREELVRRFNETGPGHLSRAWRQPVV